ncbi:MAG: 2-oxo acid dehydrogenase subunit E2 [Anaerolineae bacterium]|nr:2-oxo acid dehydrogenase subunit E2 [Anaerolineae bacterium]
MATAVVMPQLGNSVETSIISSWKKKKGDKIAAGEVLCDVETDKATIDVESPFSGVLLELFFKEGDEVPVMTNIAAIGEPGENAEDLRPTSAAPSEAAVEAVADVEPEAASSQQRATMGQLPVHHSGDGKIGISPRARHLALDKGLDVLGLMGTGPNGRIIERDIRAALSTMPKMTPLAKSMVTSGDFVVAPGVHPARITSRDLVVSASSPQAAASGVEAPPLSGEGEILQVIPLKGVRKLIATRMMNSLQTTAQLTMNASADARALLDYRKRLKGSSEALGLQGITINDLVLYAVSRTLLRFPDLNSLFVGESITQYRRVHLGFAVDTPRGLIVPVIRNASSLSLQALAQESKRLSIACQNGTVSPDDLNGATFSVTNLGSLGIETFTPVLNPPQVAILGVGNVNLKPVEESGEIVFIPHIGLSLTINHQVVDGAPGARFLQAFTRNLAELDLLLAL